jgi:hypothetical protein
MTVFLTRTLIPITTVVLSLALLTPHVFAQVEPEDIDASVAAEAEATAQPTGAIEARASSSAEVTARGQSQRASTTSQRNVGLETRAQERVTNLAANMSNRMEAVVARLQNITNRLESRMGKMADIDTTASAAALDSAQLSLDAAITEMANIDADVAATISSADARAAWVTLKTKFITIQNFIKTAHSELGSSIALLKEASLTAETEQSTAAEVE